MFTGIGFCQGTKMLKRWGEECAECVNQESIPLLQQKSPFKCFRVVLEMASQIPPEFEMLVTGKIHGRMDSVDSWREVLPYH